MKPDTALRLILAYLADRARAAAIWPHLDTDDAAAVCTTAHWLADAPPPHGPGF